MRKIIMASITAVVVIAVLAGTLIPVLDDATATTDTYTNDGYFRMTHYDDTTDHTLTWSYEDPANVVVDDVTVPIDYSVASGSVSVVVDTNFIVRLNIDSSGDPTSLAYLASSSGTKVATVADSQTASFTFSSGTLTATVGSSSVTSTYDDIYLPTLDGAFIMKGADDVAYILGDSELVAYGTTRVSVASGTMASPGVGISFVGTYDDGVTGTVWRNYDSQYVTLSDIVVNATADGDHEDLYKFSSITATATCTETVDDETVTTDSTVTYSYLLVPYEVTADRTVQFTDEENAILNAIPVIVIVALLLGVIAIVLRSRMD